MRYFVLLFCCAVLVSGAVARAEKGTKLAPPLATAGKVVIDEKFDGPNLDKTWVVAKGDWQIKDGSLVGKEKKEDMHAAVLALSWPNRNSVIQFSFKLNGATGVNLSLNHAKGHLFRIGISENGLTISKDKDKKDPNSKAVALGKVDGKLAAGKWHTMEVEIVGDTVSAQTDSGIKVSGKDPALNVDKTGYRFVARGEALSLDDVTVWQLER